MFVFPEAFAPYIHAILSIFLPLQSIQCCPSVAGSFRADSKLIVYLSLIENIFVIENSSTIAQLLYHQLRIQYHLLFIKYKLFLLRLCKNEVNFYLTRIQLLYHYKAWILCVPHNRSTIPAYFTQKSIRAALTSLCTESLPHTQRSHSDVHRRQHNHSA